MTLFDERTVVLSAPPAHRAPAGPPPWGRIVLLAVLLVALTVTAFATAEAVARAEAQREFAALMRSAMSLPESQRIDVDIAGPVFLQKPFEHYDSVTLSIRSLPVGGGNADLTMTLRDVYRENGDFVMERASGAYTMSPAQATALLLPAELRGAFRVGFRGPDLTFDGALTSGQNSVAISVATTPRFDAGRVSGAISSVTVGDTTLSAQEFAEKAGPDAASHLQAPAICIDEALPRWARVHDAQVVDQRLSLGFDIDVATFDTPAGNAPGSCP